ncbi:MAG: translesion error-prone DNA polymerase V autoproteolytic subunit [Actinomycetota bacterium]|nr:translesion error-prone DNA polymerase V autoproteolytic subunit [Actinomycetota bacterium]MDA3013373.1 translesion error-prone DNA polymerase V autoproteolytic subunit [Actinomycetota bacterium]
MPRGGARKNAGRPKGQGKYGEKTKALRIPLSKVKYISEVVSKGLYELPLYSDKVAAGFPSPADDYLEDKIDLNQYLVKHPASTFLVRASGESMINAGIFPNDILVVDRSLKAENGNVVIAVVDNELTVKRYRKVGNKIELVPENKRYQKIVIEKESEAYIWGVVTNVIHQV